MGEDEQSLHHILHKTGVILYYEHTSDMLIAAGGFITCSTKACLLLVLWLYPLCPSGWCFPGILPQASALTLQSSLKIKPRLGNFLGSPVVKTPCFQCRGRGFDPWVGNWNPLAGVQTLARPLLQLRIPPARDLTSQSIMPDPYCCDRQPLQCNQKEEKSEMGSSPSDPLRPFSQQPASPHSLLAILTSHQHVLQMHQVLSHPRIERPTISFASEGLYPVPQGSVLVIQLCLQHCILTEDHLSHHG